MRDLDPSGCMCRGEHDVGDGSDVKAQDCDSAGTQQTPRRCRQVTLRLIMPRNHRYQDGSRLGSAKRGCDMRTLWAVYLALVKQ